MSVRSGNKKADDWADELTRLIAMDNLSADQLQTLVDVRAYLIELSALAASEGTTQARQQKMDLKIGRNSLIKNKPTRLTSAYRDWATVLLGHLNEPSEEEAKRIRNAIRKGFPEYSDRAVELRYNKHIKGQQPSFSEDAVSPISDADRERLLWSYIEKHDKPRREIF